MRERLYLECPKCGARGGCEKHGLSSTGIDLRARAFSRSTAVDPRQAVLL